MQIDATTFAARLKSLLPRGWFADNAPIVDAILASFAQPWSSLSLKLSYVVAQTRIQTASDVWLDLIGADFFGSSLQRRQNEPDETYRARIKSNILMEAGTRKALIDGIVRLTGSTAQVFEPANCADTGGYGEPNGGPEGASRGFAYGLAGGWGSMGLPYQVFITIVTEPEPGEPTPSAYGVPAGGYSAGSLVYSSLSQVPGDMTDAEIRQILKRFLPVNCISWLRFV